MKIKPLTALVVALALGPVHGNAPQRVGNYDFTYEISGDTRVRPVQVFDDGKQTYFQFRAGEPVPAIFTQGANGPVMQTPGMHGPYVQVNTIAHGYALRLGRSSGAVVYGGKRSDETAQTTNSQYVSSPANSGALPRTDWQSVQGGAGTASRPTPRMDRLLASVGGIEALPRSAFDEQPPPRIAVDVNSYAVPIKGDLAQFQPNGVSPTVSTTPNTGSSPTPSPELIQFTVGSAKLAPGGIRAVQNFLKKAPPGSTFEIVGHDDPSYKGELAANRARSVADELVKGGVSARLITGMTSDRQIPSSTPGISNGVSIVIKAGSGDRQSVKAQAYVDTAQIQEASLSSLVALLQAKKITPSEAAKRIEEMRKETFGHHVQPTSGFQEAQISRWTMRAGDGNVQGVLTRWANDAGWQLIWRGGPDIKVHGDAELVRDGFVSAADYVLRQARTYGHKIRGSAYSNKVLVVTAD